MPTNPYEPPKEASRVGQAVLIAAAMLAAFILFVWLATWHGYYDPARDDGIQPWQSRIIFCVQAIVFFACMVAALYQWRASAKCRMMK